MVVTNKKSKISTNTQSVHGSKQLVIAGAGKAIIGNDSFETWLNLMKVYGITENKELGARLNKMANTNYRHWELTRWKRKTRGVPKDAHNFMCEEILYWCLSGDCLMPEGQDNVKNLVARMMANRFKAK